MLAPHQMSAPAVFFGGAPVKVAAVRAIAARVAAGELPIEAIDQETVSAALFTADIPDPDLVVRTSGEMRLSNFLMWQAAYSEFVFTPVLWPNFDETAFDAAIDELRAYTDAQDEVLLLGAGEIAAEAAERGANSADEDGAGHAGSLRIGWMPLVRRGLEATTRRLTRGRLLGTLLSMQRIPNGAWWCMPGRDPVR